MIRPGVAESGVRIERRAGVIFGRSAGARMGTFAYMSTSATTAIMKIATLMISAIR
jgi:hypothetical protein